MRVKNIGSNMTEVETSDYLVLVSYQTPVACEVKKTGECFKTREKWSNTTSKHISKWLEQRKVEEKDQSFFDNLI